MIRALAEWCRRRAEDRLRASLLCSTTHTYSSGREVGVTQQHALQPSEPRPAEESRSATIVGEPAGVDCRPVDVQGDLGRPVIRAAALG